MKFSLLFFASALTWTSDAFIHNSHLLSRQTAFASTNSRVAFVNNPPTIASPTRRTELHMESDFSSAMPEAPKQTTREFLEKAADKSIATVVGSLGEGVEAVPEVDELRQLRKNKSTTDEQLALGIYSLMIERGMTYDEDDDTGTLTPTDFDIQANLEVPEVKQEFSFLYKYGMSLITKGLASVDGIKEVVQKRLIARTGKTPEEFDEWLGF